MNRGGLPGQLRSMLKNLLRGWEGKTGIAFKDLVTGDEFLHNPDHVFPAASVIKIAILLELFRQAEKEDLDLNEQIELKPENKVGGCGVLFDMSPGLVLTLKDLAVLMIEISDNTASNMLIDRLGMRKINRLLRSHGLFKSGIHRRFMVRPNTKISKNFITPREIMILLDKLYRREILSGYYTDTALEILSRQQYREKLPRFLPPEIKVAHKPGEITGVSHDAGIVLLPGHPYILCVFVEGVKSMFQGDELIGNISLMVYQYIVEE
ncbi:MAG: serine hydrolase [Candidatus Eremiobacteraeota bacterium]|nr:serine hydrolase [Candidatus Eremiobacteraeota bacterium]